MAVEPLALVGATVVVGSGRVVLRDSTVLVSGGRIASVGSSPPPPGCQVLEAGGQTVMPGLIDAHVHLTSLAGAGEESRAEALERCGQRLLEAGITTVRDLGAAGGDLWALRRRASSGAVASPRLVLCGQVISAVCPGARAFPGMYRESSGDDDLRAAVAEQARAGADVVKVMATGALTVPDEDVHPAQLTGDELGAVVGAARDVGLPVASHAEGREGIELSVAAGADTIEHGEMGYEAPASLDAMAERGAVLVPTLSVFDHVAESDSYAAWMRERARRLGEAARRTVDAARRRGVTIAAGADAPPAGGSAQELLRLADAGLTNLEAIEAATGGSAVACRLGERVGTVVVGRLADLVVVDGDPLRDLGLLADPGRLRLVLQAGTVVARSGRLATDGLSR